MPCPSVRWKLFKSMGKKKSKADRISAGLLMYRVRDNRLEVFLAHPGGPYFRFKDEGHWTIPKGEIDKGEELLETAIREFLEEVGLEPHGPYIEIGSITQKGGKIVHAWAFEGDRDESTPHVCNTFKMEWPPQSGRMQEFPEIDRVGFFRIPDARVKLKETQWDFLDRLAEHLGIR
ncbi:MAG: MutT-like protein [Verrucomicrobiales bacterium]|nr:MutT-like protein [Verrucomicrobiales bacterium]